MSESATSNLNIASQKMLIKSHSLLIVCCHVKLRYAIFVFGNVFQFKLTKHFQLNSQTG